jgi:hypothetical protein
MVQANRSEEARAVSSVTAVQIPAKGAVVERWFFTAMAGAMLAVAISGFAPSIVITSGRRAPLSPLAAAHGVVFFIWLCIFFVQARLIATGHIALHKRVGVAAAIVAAVMIPLAYATCFAMVRRGFDLSGDLRVEHDPAYEVIFPLGDVMLFSVLVAAAIAYRRRPEIHKTLILFANIALMPAPLAHLIGHIPWLAAMPGAIIMAPITLFLAAAVGRDFLLKGRVSVLTWGVAATMFMSGPLRAGLIGPSATWHRLVHWLAR